jgi:hypothetical protein
LWPQRYNLSAVSDLSKKKPRFHIISLTNYSIDFQLFAAQNKRSFQKLSFSPGNKASAIAVKCAVFQSAKPFNRMTIFGRKVDYVFKPITITNVKPFIFRV